MNQAVSFALAWAISAASIALMLLRPRRIPEAVWLSAGALLLVVSGALPWRDAGRAIAEGTDVYLFLAGMMLLAELAKHYGVFDWLAQLALDHAAGRPVDDFDGGSRSPLQGGEGKRRAARLFTLIYGVGIAVTVLMSNDATAVVLTPAVLAAVRRARVRPLPCLFACALVANAASFVLPISNPANLVVFRQGVPPLGAWLAAFALPSAAAVVATYLLLRWRFSGEMRGQDDSEAAGSGETALERRTGLGQRAGLSRPGRMTLYGIFCFVAVLLAASALKQNLGLPTCVAAVLAAAAVCIRERENPWRLAREMSWSILPLVASLFILMEAIERAGALSGLRHVLAAAAKWPLGSSSLAIGIAAGVGANLVNNLPLGLLAGAALAGGHFHRLWSSAVMIGVDLGPNLSTTGSLATILWLIALRREGVEVSAWRFLKTGLWVMPPALLLALCAALAARAL